MDKVSVLQKVFNFILTLWVSSCSPFLTLGLRAAGGPPGPQGQVVPFLSHPEKIKSEPDVAPGPVTMEVKVKGNHVKSATHHPFLHRKISTSGLGVEVKCASNLGGMVGKCATMERNNNETWKKRKEKHTSVKQRCCKLKEAKWEQATSPHTQIFGVKMPLRKPWSSS